MNVLFVTAAHNIGGAGRAAQRLAEALARHGVNGSWLALRSSRPNQGDGEAQHLVAQSKLAYTGARLADRLLALPYGNGPSLLRSLNYSSGSSLFGASELINQLKPDLVHLHWVNYGLLSPGDIAAIKAPVVWTMHDMWPLSGGCHYDMGCGRHATGCGLCPVLGSQAPGDISSRLAEAKQAAWSGRTIHCVSPSHWLANTARASVALGGQPVTVIPNPLDLHAFRPMVRHEACQRFGIDNGRPAVLFGGMKGVKNPVKGARHVEPILRKLAELNAETQVIVMGAGDEDRAFYEHGLPVKMLGHLGSTEDLRAAYSAASVFAIPSEQDNLPNTVLEALACGTQVVGFAIGGIPDMVVPGITGALAQPFDTDEFAGKLAGVIQQASDSTATACRHRAEAMADPDTVASAYLAVYREAVGDGQASRTPDHDPGRTDR